MANGVFWPTLFQGDNENIRKVLYGSWLIRDWNFAATSLTGATFFGSDGNLVNTLFSSSNPGGAWNDFGYMDAKGPKFAQKLETKPTEVMQSRWPGRYDYTKESLEISATLMESNPIVDAVHNNQPLANGVQSVGTIGYASSAPVELDLIWRQCVFIGVDGRSGENYYEVRVFPKVLIDPSGDTEWNIENAASLPIKALAVPDDFSVSPDGIVGAPQWILRDGPAWRAKGGPVLWPTPQVAPVATAISGAKATIVFAQPTSPNTPFTYTVAKTTSSTTTSATIVGSPSVSSGTVTITVSGLTVANSYTFTVTATGANGTSQAGSVSNSITAIS